jgi:hypothetical protein
MQKIDSIEMLEAIYKAPVGERSIWKEIDHINHRACDAARVTYQETDNAGTSIYSMRCFHTDPDAR